MKECKKCMLCKANNVKVIHKGVRDNKDINVLKCLECGLVYLSDFSVTSNNEFYENGGMHSGINAPEIDFQIWRNNSYEEDKNRVNQILKNDIELNKKILDFGCGNGGYLKILKDLGYKWVYGVELENNCIQHILAEDIVVKSNINDFDEKFDYISMFHVIEHLAEPEQILGKIKKHMNKGGKLIIETPNADDALLSLYDCEKFADFTYWSCHVILYNISTLSRLLEQCGFKIVSTKHIQRFPITNHLYWLSKGEPGGHKIWDFLYDEKLNEKYMEKLVELGKTDTILVTCEYIG